MFLFIYYYFFALNLYLYLHIIGVCNRITSLVTRKSTDIAFYCKIFSETD